MKKAIFLCILFLFSIVSTSLAQLPSPPLGGNKKAWTGERIGITDVNITYDRPGVKGREGKIYGTPVVHEGFQDLGFGTSKAAPWRAGSNENTTIEFSTDVKVEGKDLAAGKYGFFVAYGKDECILIFSKENAAWGSFFYTDKEDALRVKVKPVALDKSVEWLKFEFSDQTNNSAIISLQWEKLSIPFKVEVDLINTTLSAYRKELKGNKGFSGPALQQAAAFCASNNINLEEGLTWSNDAVLYQKNFQSLSTRSAILQKLGRKTQADSTMQAALPLGTMNELHFYGKQLLSEKKSKEALEVFKTNAAKNPKQFTTYAGLTRGYSAVGDYKTALANAKLALPLAPNPPNKVAIEEMIKKLETGKDVN